MEPSKAEKPEYDLFLSHNTVDKPVVEALARALWARHGIRAWVDKWDLPLGKPWQDEMLNALRSVNATVVCIGPHGIGRWQEEELRVALDEATRVPKRLVIPVLLPKAPSRPQVSDFLLQRTWENLEPDWDGGVARIARALRPVTAPPSNRGAECPYRGLEAFREEDARWFYGRGTQVSNLLGRLRSKKKEDYFIVVAGASGSGKSSLVRAGLIPSVRTGELDSSYEWQVLIMRPGRTPCQRLAQELVDLDARNRKRDLSVSKRSDEIDELARHLQKRDDGLTKALDTILGADSRLMLVIDQFEEIFTVGSDEQGLTKESLAFLKSLLSATEAHRDGRTRVVATLRADFLDRCLEIPPLATRLQSAVQFALPPLSEQDLREVIVEPARAAGCDVDPALVEDLVRIILNQPGNLPLLQFTLRALWNLRSNGQLTYDSYRKLGKLENAVTQYADGIVREAEGQGQIDSIRRVFLRLVHVSVNTPDARRTASVQEFEHDPNELRALDFLTEARLVTQDGQTVDLAHEILLRDWKQLQHWIKGDPEALHVQQRLSDAARDWEENRRGASYLWTGPRLAQVTELLSAKRIAPPHRERAFIDAARMRTRRFRLLQIAAVVLLVAIAGITFSLWLRAESATTEVWTTLRKSLLQEASAQCRNVLPGTRESGLEALRAAARIRPGLDLRNAYVECLLRPGLRRLRPAQTSAAASSRSSTSPQHEVGGGVVRAKPGRVDGQVEISTEKAGARLSRWTAQGDSSDSVRLSVDGRFVAATLYPKFFDEQSVGVWDAETGALLYSLAGEPVSSGKFTHSSSRLSFTERYLAVAGHSGSVFAWDLWTIGSTSDEKVPPRRALAARPFADEAIATAVSPDGRWVAALGDNEMVVLENETGVVVARERLHGWIADEEPFEWLDASTLRYGSQAWHWAASVDQGFFLRANRGRERRVNDMAFDREGRYLGISSDYNGGPTIVEFGASSPSIHMLRAGASIGNNRQDLAFSPSGELCSLGIGCEPCANRSPNVRTQCAACLSVSDFRPGTTFRCESLVLSDAAFVSEDLMVTGVREPSNLLAIDWPSGRVLWSRMLSREGGSPLAYNDQGDIMVLPASDDAKGDSFFEAIQTRSGDIVETAREKILRFSHEPTFMDGQFVLLDTTNVSIRRFGNPSPIKGPHLSSEPDWNARWYVKGALAIEHKSRGGMTVWDLRAGRRCFAPSPSTQRKLFLSASKRLYGGYDGYSLTVWRTSDCSVVARFDVEAVEDFIITPDDLTLRYLGPNRQIMSVVIGSLQGPRSTPPLALAPGCDDVYGSGFSQDGTQYYTACGVSRAELLVRVWNTETGRLLSELRHPLDAQDPYPGVSFDPFFHTLIIVTSQQQGRLWQVGHEGSPEAYVERCPNVSMRPKHPTALRFLGGGRLLAWIEPIREEDSAADAGRFQERAGAVLLRAIDPSSCADVMSLRLERSDVLLVGATPSGGIAVASDGQIQAYGRDGQVEWSALEDAIDGVDIVSAALSSNGSHVAAALRTGSVVVGVPGESVGRWLFAAGPGRVTSLIFSPDARWLAAGTSDGRVHLWDLTSIEAQLEAAGLGWKKIVDGSALPAME